MQPGMKANQKGTKRGMKSNVSVNEGKNLKLSSDDNVGDTSFESVGSRYCDNLLV
jgi:hypothetical protein